MQRQQPDHLGKRVTREELYECVWSKTLKALAKEWNTTHEQLLLACKRMNVPRPSQRYWPLISWGHKVKRKPLPRRSRKVPGEVFLPRRDRDRSHLAVEMLITDEERRREAEERGLEERRRIEEQRRKQLVGSSEAWLKARRLRRFIRACEVTIRKKPSLVGATAEAWLSWAGLQADLMDPTTNRFLEEEIEREKGGKD